MSKGVKRALSVIVILALLVGAVWGGLVLYRNSQRKPVKVFEAQNFAMTDFWEDQSQAAGMVRTEGIQSVSLSTASTVTEIYVTEGQEVKQGDPLLSFDTTLSQLEVEKAEIAVGRQKLAIQTAEKELSQIKALRPSSGMDTVIEPTYTPAPMQDGWYRYENGGTGTEGAPYVILWDEASGISVSRLEKVLAQMPQPSQPGLVLTPVGDDEADPESTDGDGTQPADSLPGESGEQPEDGLSRYKGSDGQIYLEQRNEETGERTFVSEATGEPLAEGTYTVAGEEASDGTYVIVIKRMDNMRDSAVTEQVGLHLTEGEGGESDIELFSVYGLPEYVDEEAMPIIIPDTGSGLTAAQIAQMRNDKELELKDLRLQLQIAEVDLKKMQAESSDGIVRAQMDGVVKTVNDPDEAYQNGTPILTVSGGGGYYIEGQMSELDLDTVQVGLPVTVNSWMTGTTLEGTIVEVGDTPSDNGMYYGGGNPNVSYYPFTVFVDDSAELTEGEYVDMSFQAGGPTTGFYLENMFIRSENGRSYVMVRGEDGLLEKRFVQVGRDLWGSYTQIRGGLGVDGTWIAFPYGQDVTEGAKTQEAAPSELYEGMY